MKKALGIVALVLFVLLILGLLILKLLPSRSNTNTEHAFDSFKNITAPSISITNDSPENAVTSCYHWYLYYVANNAVPFEQIASQPQIAQCFTQSFINSWPGLDVDPITLSQDYLSSWDKDLHVSLQSQSVRSVDMQVIFGTGAETKTLIAHVIKDGADWKIDSVSQ